MGDLTKKKRKRVFFLDDLVITGDLSRKKNDGLIVMGDLPKRKSGVIVIGDLPR